MSDERLPLRARAIYHSCIACGYEFAEIHRRPYAYAALRMEADEEHPNIGPNPYDVERLRILRAEQDERQGHSRVRVRRMTEGEQEELDGRNAHPLWRR